MASLKIYSKEQTDALLQGKADTSALPSVVQVTGQSTTAVMSQKAVTDALAGAGGGAIHTGYATWSALAADLKAHIDTAILFINVRSTASDTNYRDYYHMNFRIYTVNNFGQLELLSGEHEVHGGLVNNGSVEFYFIMPARTSIYNLNSDTLSVSQRNVSINATTGAITFGSVNDRFALSTEAIAIY